MFRFLLLIFIFSVIIMGVAYAGVHQGVFALPSFFWLILVFLTFSSTLIFYLLFRGATGTGFTQLYLLSVVGKILGYGIFMALIIFFDRNGAPGNVVFFMTTYICFTGLEVALLFKKFNG